LPAAFLPKLLPVASPRFCPWTRRSRSTTTMSARRVPSGAVCSRPVSSC